MKAYLDDFKLIRLEDISNINEISFIMDNRNINLRLNNLDVVLEEEIILESDYHLYLNNQEVMLESRLIEHSNRFEALYHPDLKILGSFYSKDNTTFRVWSPLSKTVNLILNYQRYPMQRMDKGVFETTINGDFDKAIYHYELIDNNSIKAVDDPFSYQKLDNLDSYVIDLNKIDYSLIKPNKSIAPVVYELSVRDYTSVGDFKYPKTFKGLNEKLDYLASLGISHLELLPILDFDNDNSDYNWGYNPIGFNTIKNDYFFNTDPYLRISELKELINNLHYNNIRVILDVVFNHVYKKEMFNLAKYLKYYFYRYDNTKISDATGLGNELRSESPFLKEYLVMMSLRLVKIYDVDGFRYDLSGLVAKKTCNLIKEEIDKIKDDCLFIGEGWNIEGTVLPFKERCSLDNNKEIPGFYFFNPRFRDTLKELLKQDESLRQDVKEVMVANNYLLDKDCSLNYIECHDDMTIYDYLKSNLNEDEELIKQRCRFGLALVLLSKGLPFLQAGEEFFRTKRGKRNSYNLDDSYNLFDWKRLNENKDSVDYLRDLICIRKDIINYLNDNTATFKDYYEAYIIEIADLRLAINPCPFDHLYVDGNNYQVLFDGNKKTNEIKDGVKFPRYTVTVYKLI